MTAETQTTASDHDSEDVSAIPGRIHRVTSETPFRDVMHGDARWEIPVHDHGFVALVDAMPRLVPDGQTADSAIVQAARVSYGAGEPFWFPSWVISRTKKHRTFLNSCSAKWLPHPRLETGLKMGKQKLCTPHAALLHCQIYMTNKVSHLYEYCGISISFARDD